jgi:hypothetical protein
MYAQNLDIDNPLLNDEIKAEEPTETPDEVELAFMDVEIYIQKFVKAHKGDSRVDKYKKIVRALDEMYHTIHRDGQLSLDTEFR